MLSPEYLDGVAEPLQAIYSDLETKITADVAWRIAKADYSITPTTEWQLKKLSQIGASSEYINQQLAKTLKLSDSEMETIFNAAGTKSLKTDTDTQTAMIEAGTLKADSIPLAASSSFAQVINANLIRTNATMRKLTGTLAIDTSGKLNRYLDQCQLMVQSGAFTKEQAIDTTVRQFSADGIGILDYASGATISIEAGVRRAVVTGISQATGEISLSNADALGTDLVEVTWHADQRPEHAIWAGKIYSISGNSTKYPKLSTATGYGTGAGLKGWNCRHDFYPYVEGISEKVPREKYDDETYQNEQQQRYNERMIRYWKKRSETMKVGGVSNGRELKKVSEWQAKQRRLLKETGLTRDYTREKVW